MDRFFWAVGTDLPWEDPQIRYRLGTDNYEDSLKEGGWSNEERAGLGKGRVLNGLM
jgi:hypothetical protein